MNIYEPEGSEGIIDLRAAERELRAVGSITSESARKAAVAELNTAALLDIALSLRIVAAEARAAMPPPFTETTEPGHADDRDRDFLIEGDLVAVDGLDDPAEVVGFGQSEGTVYANIKLIDGTEARAWLDTLTRLVGDERDDDAMQEAAEASVAELRALNAAADAEGELDETPDVDDAREAHELASEIDDDFDGDTHNAAANALDVLKANEAARKAAKKKGGKK